MAEQRIYNFSAGPAMMPVSVLETAAKEMLNYHGSGMSVMEMSHRSKVYDALIQNVEASLRRILGVPDHYKVLFLQGGATQQFSSVPINLMKTGLADYIVTGHFAKKAAQEAEKFGEVHIAATSEPDSFCYIPKQEQLKLSPEADYVYICANNTIYGTEWHYVPDTKGVTLVADMSSNILAEVTPVERYAVIYAGAQKNISSAGLTIVIVREDMLERSMDICPTMLKWKTQADADSLYNTPPTYQIYIAGLVFEHLLSLGGVAEMEKINRYKAGLLYDFIDNSDFYTNSVAKEDRSLMNVPFVTPSKETDAAFVAQAAANGLLSLKGHRLVGGMRASIYNAMPVEGVKALIEFMKKFETENK